MKVVEEEGKAGENINNSLLDSIKQNRKSIIFIMVVDGLDPT